MTARLRSFVVLPVRITRVPDLRTSGRGNAYYRALASDLTGSLETTLELIGFGEDHPLRDMSAGEHCLVWGRLGRVSITRSGKSSLSIFVDGAMPITVPKQEDEEWERTPYVSGDIPTPGLMDEEDNEEGDGYDPFA